MIDPDFEEAIRAHDQALSVLGLDIWCGAEPTFTDRNSEAPEWINTALGGIKERRAEALLRVLQQHLGRMVLRTVGRQYPGEDLPRWSLGIYDRRDGASLWQGPPDPLLIPDGSGSGSESHRMLEAPDLSALQTALVKALAGRGFEASAFSAPGGTLRVLFWPQGDRPEIEEADPRLHRPSVHVQAIAPEGLRDELAEAGLGLLILDTVDVDGGTTGRIELPAMGTTGRFARVLEGIDNAARRVGLATLILAGYPPPVDSGVQWTTITPDPAVIEVNMAPYPDVSGLLAAKRILYAAAAEVGLVPYRLHYNGTVSDSGGGGQITLGGPSPEESPFLREPRLLPRLIRYCNHHPALSYLFAHDYLGSSGQAVRADERGREAFHELCLALTMLAHDPRPTPERIASGLAQFMTDNCGNSHRAELNIEKLWNARLPARGMQGLVEFRAFRMQHSPERAAALSALLRAVLAMLITREFEDPLLDWGDELHERFAQPFYLERDLEAILYDLAIAGVGLHVPVTEELLRCDGFRDWASLDHDGVTLSVRRAVEFWPLVGDVGSQERGDSRLVDSSTARIELCLRAGSGVTEEVFADWQLTLDGFLLPLREDRDAQGPVKVFALRYRGFVPRIGLHPALGSHGPVRLILFHPRRADALHLTLYEWRPDDAAYPGLPTDLADARQRRVQRCVAIAGSVPMPASLRPPPSEALSHYTFDLRWPIPQS